MYTGVFNVFEKNLRLNRDLANTLSKKIREYWETLRQMEGLERLKIMNFCGTHEWSVTYYGLRRLVPEEIELVAGPGCPVCVTPSQFVEELIKLALDGVIVYAYGDVFKLRSHRRTRGASSLSEARSLGAEVRVVTDVLSAARDASEHGKPSVFTGIGFETVAPGYAQAVIKKHLPRNLKLLSLVKLTPPSMFYALEVSREKPTEPPVMGVIAPGHVSTITGAKAWEPVSENFGIPVVVSGFEPIDVLASILEILKQLVNRKARTVVEYKRCVTREGDLKAQLLINRVFEVVDDAWRGIGYLPKSGLRLRHEYKDYDAFLEYGVRDVSPETWSYDMPSLCRCAEVVLGKAYPSQCPLFLKSCTPNNPIGPCMVSVEGACAIWARHGSHYTLLKLTRELER